MKLIEPKVELWSEENISTESHIARCARVCYGKEDKLPDQNADKKMVDGLIKRAHMSMLRHSSFYGRMTLLSEIYMPQWTHSEYVNDVNDVVNGKSYISTNRQFVFERSPNWAEELGVGEFLELCKKDPTLFSIFRLTFCITTQISTSRELNRVSPNNIAERSTRYCSSKDGLEICKPWWWEEKIGSYSVEEIAKLPNDHKVIAMAWHELEESYMELLKCGMKPEDARGVLPLDTATKVVMTYSIREWKHIIDLRYYGKTGKPHENARIVIGMVRNQINDFAKKHEIDYKL